MALISGLDRPSLTTRVAPYIKAFCFMGLSGILVTQCQSIQGLKQTLTELQRQPVAVTIGRNSFVEVGEPLSPEKNAEEFLREALPLLQTLSNKVPKEMDPACQKDAACKEGRDSGLKVDGVVVPTLVGISANTITPSARKPILSSVLSNAETLLGRPVRWGNGEALVYQVFSIESKGNEEFEVIGGYFHYSPKGDPIAAYEHDVYVSLGSILPPKPIANPTVRQKAIAVALGRGYQITDLEVLR